MSEAVARAQRCNYGNTPPTASPRCFVPLLLCVADASGVCTTTRTRGGRNGQKNVEGGHHLHCLHAHAYWRLILDTTPQRLQACFDEFRPLRSECRLRTTFVFPLRLGAACPLSPLHEYFQAISTWNVNHDQPCSGIITSSHGRHHECRIKVDDALGLALSCGRNIRQAAAEHC